MKSNLILLALLILLLPGCAGAATPTPQASETLPAETAVPTEVAAPTESPTSAKPLAPVTPLYKDASQPTAARVEDLLARMSLAEKIGQMTQVEKDSVSPEQVQALFIGSVLSGGGGSPPQNNAEAWAKMVDGFQSAALATPLGIPLIYGVDAVHGHGNLQGATIFPHNIALGAANDPALMFRIGQITAAEMWATGIPWNFGPVVAVPQDIRWGRTYEGFSESTELVTRLAIPYLEGLQSGSGESTGSLYALATAKHYLGDGGTSWGTSTTSNMGVDYRLDQGDMQMDEAQVRALFLPPYQAAVEAGAQAVMASFNSWNGAKLHAQKFLMTEVLKGELGFAGFVVSDWGGIDQISPDYYSAVVTAINAGVDMNMVPYDAPKFISILTQAVENGDVSMARIDDAVRRILTVKFDLGLFEQPYSRPELLDAVGSEEHRAIAREAVRKSLVLLKNENNALPIAKDLPVIFVAGQHANDIGLQCGGWTMEWQGKAGNITPGTTILEGIQAVVGTETEVIFDKTGKFSKAVDENGNPRRADLTIVVMGESPYTEGVGDRADLRLSASEIQLLSDLRARSQTLILVLISGRPLVVSEAYPLVDGLVAAWLPGSEGGAVAEVLFGDYPFTGKTPYSWPRTNEQLPINVNNIGDKTGCAAPLFPFGFGLGEAGSAPLEWLECP